MSPPAIETVLLNNGLRVLAVKHQRFGYGTAYANLSQARAKVAELTAQGIKCHVRDSKRPFYVVID